MDGIGNHDALDHEALAWLVRLDDDPGNDLLYAELELWLQRSPAHRMVWNRALDLAGEVEAALPAAAISHGAQPDKPAADVVPIGSRASLRRQVAAHWRSIGAFAVAASLCLAIVPDIALRFQAQEMTGTGEVKRVDLSDGSMVYLAPGSAISSDIDQGGRSVSLLRGRAFFDVKRDPGRPFEVAAGEATVTVLGTAFEVDRSDMQAFVAVQRGLVDVAGAGRESHTLLHRGEAVTLDRLDLPKREAVHPERIAGWRQGKLFVKDRPIGEVLGELRPWYSGYIMIRGSGLQKRRVTGIYDPRQTDLALSALSRAHPLSVRQVTPWLRVVTVN